MGSRSRIRSRSRSRRKRMLKMMRVNDDQQELA
jgi:hypothetical protein